MNKRFTIFLIIVLAILLSTGLTACEKERPAPTPSRATPAPVRGAVSPTLPPPSAITQVAPAAASGAAAGQATPSATGAATPMAPTAQPVVVSPGSTGGATGSGQVSTYTVVAGDTLASIAAKFGTTLEALAQLNNLADPNALALGQELKIAGSPVGGTTGAAGGTSTYVIQAGDTLAAIARRYGTTVAQLVQLNNLANPDVISLGQKLIVPAAGGAAVAPSTDTTAAGQTRSYVVQAGDTLLKIARKFGVTVQQLQTANKITNPDRIYPGQVLAIP